MTLPARRALFDGEKGCQEKIEEEAIISRNFQRKMDTSLTYADAIPQVILPAVIAVGFARCEK